MYGQLDALLVPSSTESVSYAALEAMASGLPVVARNVDGLPYTLGSAGILHTDDQMIDALQRDDPWLRQQLPAAAGACRAALRGADVCRIRQSIRRSPAAGFARRRRISIARS